MIGNDADDTCPRCEKCEQWRNAPDFIREPFILWDRFPCPPPGTDKAKLIVELDWTGRMGPVDGCEAFRRVIRRCNVHFKNVTLPEKLLYCDNSSVLGFCGTQCVIAIILACILLCFIFILVIVCCRYVRRNDKSPVSGVCTKVVGTEHSSTLNSQQSRYYIQSQYYYRAGNIPERRGLPFEVRATENGVEARLIKAIQTATDQGFDETCPHCRHSLSRHSTASSSNCSNRQGYETIYWRDKGGGLERRQPSSDSFPYRRQLDRQGSRTGSVSDAPHYYEHIGDTPIDSNNPNVNTHAGRRRSNHSILYITGSGSQTYKDHASVHSDTRSSDDERMLSMSKFIIPVQNRDKPTRVSNKSVDRQLLYSEDSRSLLDHTDGCRRSPCNCVDTEHNKKVPTETLRNHNSIPALPPEPRATQTLLNNPPIGGYRYIYNPNFDEDSHQYTTTTTSRRGDVSSSPCTPSDFLEFDDISDSPTELRTTSPGGRSLDNKLKHRKLIQMVPNNPCENNESKPTISKLGQHNTYETAFRTKDNIECS